MNSDKLRPYTIQEVAERMSLSEHGAKAWIKTFLPDIYSDDKRKNFFSSGEYKRIFKEFDRDQEKR